LGDLVGVTVGDTFNSSVFPDEFTAAKIPVKRNKLAPRAKIVFLNIKYPPFDDFYIKHSNYVFLNQTKPFRPRVYEATTMPFAEKL
jgi:hypothetical protein